MHSSVCTLSANKAPVCFQQFGHKVTPLCTALSDCVIFCPISTLYTSKTTPHVSCLTWTMQDIKNDDTVLGHLLKN